MSERGIVFDLKRYAINDGPGIRISVHMKGCPLSCFWCHNPESQEFVPRPLFRKDRCIACGLCVPACLNGAVCSLEDGLETDVSRCSGEGRCAAACPSGARELCGREVSVDEVMREILKERIFFEQSGGGVTITGGEPMSQPEFVLELLRECKKRELHTVLDTSGFTGPDALAATLPLTDLYLYDIKIMDPEKHRKYTGVDNEVILSNALRLGENGAAICARVPFIPGVNSDDENARATAEFLLRVPGVVQVDLLPYHSAAEDKHDRWKMEYKLRGIFPPTEQSLRHAAAIIEGYGIKTSIA
jgi:pyruvate formate lyase activating enzyme